MWGFGRGFGPAPVQGLLILLAVSSAAGLSPPLVGKGGYAVYMDRMRYDTIGGGWPSSMPDSSFTIEFWAQVLDTYQDDHAIFAYSAYDSSQSPPYDASNEISITVEPKRLYFSRLQGTFCEASDVPECEFVLGSPWFHFALTWSIEEGVVVFRDGREIRRVAIADLADTYRRPVVAHGCLSFGQEPDALCGDFDEQQSFDGIVEDLRVWNYVRTPEQIAGSWNRTLTAELGLVMAWRFDTVAADNIVEDHSGLGNDGRLGRLPTIRNEMTWGSARRPGPPTAPRVVRSGAGTWGSGIVVAFYDVATPAEAAEAAAAGGALSTTITVLELPAVDEDGDELTWVLSSLPANGTLYAFADAAGATPLGVGDAIEDADAAGHAQSKRVRFAIAAAPGDFMGDLIADRLSFDVDVADGAGGGGHVVSARVDLLPNMLPRPDDVVVELGEDEVSVVSLADVAWQGERTNATVLTLPARGALYQLRFLDGKDARYDALETDMSKAIRITAGDTVVTDPRGLLFYAPEPNGFDNNAVYANFTFVRHFGSDDGLRSPPAAVQLFVTGTNDAPQGQAQAIARGPALATAADAQLLVELDSSDVDRAQNFYVASREKPFFRITEWPRRGHLFQVLADGSKGDPIDQLGNIPTVVAWAADVRNVSAQYSLCGAGCFNMHACAQTDCGTDAWHATQILHEPDVYPRYGDIQQGWDPPLNRGFEFIELEYAFPMYIFSLSLYENYKPGSTTRIQTAAEYNGAATAWTTVWQGSVQQSADIFTIFEPPLCPVTAYKAQYVRMEFDTIAKPGWNSYDAVKVLGSLQSPAGAITDPGGRVLYELASGALDESSGVAEDRFAFKVSDCEDESAEATAITVTFSGVDAGAVPDSLRYAQVVDLPMERARESTDGGASEVTFSHFRGSLFTELAKLRGSLAKLAGSSGSSGSGGGSGNDEGGIAPSDLLVRVDFTLPGGVTATFGVGAHAATVGGDGTYTFNATTATAAEDFAFELAGAGVVATSGAAHLRTAVTFAGGAGGMADPLTLRGLVRGAVHPVTVMSLAADDGQEASAIIAGVVAAGLVVIVVGCAALWLHRRKMALTGTEDWRIDLDEIEFVELIGHGGFGEVWKGMWRGQTVALKIVSMAGGSGSAGSNGVPGSSHALPRTSMQSTAASRLAEKVKSAKAVGSKTAAQQQSSRAQSAAYATLRALDDNGDSGDPRSRAGAEDSAANLARTVLDQHPHLRQDGKACSALAAVAATAYGAGLDTVYASISTAWEGGDVRRVSGLSGSRGGRKSVLDADSHPNSPSKTEANAFDDLLGEIRTMVPLRSPFIIMMMGGCVRKPDAVLVMEYAENGSLLDLINGPDRDTLKWSERVRYMTECASGMLYLHSAGVLHRDLKSPNLLINAHGCLKVADFGLSGGSTLEASLQGSDLAANAKGPKNKPKVAAQKGIGSPFWMAPELTSSVEPGSFPSDVFAFGIIMFELMAMRLPYLCRQRADAFIITFLVAFQQQRPIIHVDQIQACVPLRWLHIMDCCWQQDPALRPPFEVVLQMLRDFSPRAAGGDLDEAFPPFRYHDEDGAASEEGGFSADPYAGEGEELFRQARLDATGVC